jgi:hypothetical protein
MSEPAPALPPEDAHVAEHAEVVRLLEQRANDLDNLEKMISVIGHRERPACPNCLAAAAWVAQFVTQTWLVRRVFFAEIPTPPSPPLPPLRPRSTPS